MGSNFKDASGIGAPSAAEIAEASGHNLTTLTGQPAMPEADVPSSRPVSHSGIGLWLLLAERL